MISIRARVTLFGVAVVAVIYAVVAVLIYVLLSYGFAEDQDRLLASRASAAVSALAELPPSSLGATPLIPIDAVATGEAIVVVLDSSGSVISSTGHVGAGPLRFPAELLGTSSRSGFAVETVPVAGVPTRVWVVPWDRGYVVAAQPIRALQVERRGMIGVLAIVGFLGLVAAFAATWFAVGRALRPLRVLASLADSVGGSADLTRRLPSVRQRDDLGRLTVSFNTMMDRLASAYARTESALAAQRRFTADASHELRTPLTTIRGNVGFLSAHPDARASDRSDALGDLEAESARMARLLDDLLLLARSDGGAAPSVSSVDLLAVARSVCRQASVSCSGSGSVLVSGDADALRRLVWILVDNALGHGSGAVSVSVSVSAGVARLVVTDEGPGVPVGLESAVFERFFRGDPAPPGGVGLGLAIARSLVAAHGGTITVTGAVFTVTLPLSSDS
ncbi:two-component sensor histidine kinase [Asanoa ishikariensis]|uniref:histidine kinase n=1 Tax=Asanoa ishikariensis TaxID=137265 RepID=A0A1H3M404_9ACTN|nr:HAMP domain-containing sensor histidine kinase [Asanoa ishikariensis]GIF65872.1 two-component sensor histidine kinase [Asanoa ishikariensis]SDY70949.1 Signal transduction histidine kinase [Asanoa ishikariensis]